MSKKRGPASETGICPECEQVVLLDEGGIPREQWNQQRARQELDALNKVVETLQPFDDQARARMLGWLRDALGVRG